MGGFGSRRTVSRMTMMKKILGNEVELPVAVFFEHQSKRTRRSHNRQLKRYQPRGDNDKHAFAQQSIPERYSLPRDIVYSDRSVSFKRLLTAHLRGKPTSD